MIFRISGISRLSLRLCLLLLCFLLLSAAAKAEVFQVENPGPGSVAITGPWQFHLGDDTAWAAPAIDDSRWEQIRGDDTWGAQQHPGYTGFAWYRKRIQVNGAGPAIAILMPPVDDVYELYWNGKKIGAYGALPPHAFWWPNGHSAVYLLGSTPMDGVLAIRVWKVALSSLDPSTLGGLNAAPLIGDPRVLAQQTKIPSYEREHRSLPRFLIAAVVAVAGLLSLLLFVRARNQWVYLWLSIYLLADGFAAVTALPGIAFGIHFTAQQVIIEFLNSFQDISLWLLLLTLFGLSEIRSWRRWTAALASLYVLAQIADIIAIFYWQFAGPALQWVDAITTVIYSLTPLYIFFLVGFGLARKRRSALWPVGIAAFLYGAWNFLYQASGEGIRFTHSKLSEYLDAAAFRVSGYSFNARFLLDTLLFLVLLYTVTRQQFLDRRRQAQIELEMRSAREVQHVLIPEETPPIPGLFITSVYKPASEVGGDFFQVIPLAASEKNPGALIILGDVSGKGLKAAMTVSLIVGTVRTLAQFTEEPAEILRGLNQRLMGRTEGGFTTCLVLRIHADGAATLANGGHLAPFRDTEELPVSGSLPLGISADANYDQIDFRLGENERLMLYTDGIVEARNSRGDLFGFERVAHLLAVRPSLQAVLDTACAFGQQDDITILSVTRVPAAETRASAVQLTAQIAPA
jgi:hypothetical protein